MLSEQTRRDIQDNLNLIRIALEERRYDDVQSAINQQRALFEALPADDVEARDLASQAQDLLSWAITLAKIQRSHLEQGFACMLRLKQFDEGYLPSPVCSAELISIKG